MQQLPTPCSAARISNNGCRPAEEKLTALQNQDPFGFAAGDANLQRYVGNDPTNATDPTGLELKIVGASLIAPPEGKAISDRELDKAFKGTHFPFRRAVAANIRNLKKIAAEGKADLRTFGDATVKYVPNWSGLIYLDRATSNDTKTGHLFSMFAIVAGFEGDPISVTVEEKRATTKWDQDMKKWVDLPLLTQKEWKTKSSGEDFPDLDLPKNAATITNSAVASAAEGKTRFFVLTDMTTANYPTIEGYFFNKHVDGRLRISFMDREKKKSEIVYTWSFDQGIDKDTKKPYFKPGKLEGPEVKSWPWKK